MKPHEDERGSNKKFLQAFTDKIALDMQQFVDGCNGTFEWRESLPTIKKHLQKFARAIKRRKVK